jgi:hypothetical protein
MTKNNDQDYECVCEEFLQQPRVISWRCPTHGDKHRSDYEIEPCNVSLWATVLGTPEDFGLLEGSPDDRALVISRLNGLARSIARLFDVELRSLSGELRAAAIFVATNKGEAHVAAYLAFAMMLRDPRAKELAGILEEFGFLETRTYQDPAADDTLQLPPS